MVILGVTPGQVRVLGEKVIGMVLNPTRVAEPENVTLPLRGPSGCCDILVLKVPLEGATKVIELLIVTGEPKLGVAVKV